MLRLSFVFFSFFLASHLIASKQFIPIMNRIIDSIPSDSTLIKSTPINIYPCEFLRGVRNYVVTTEEVYKQILNSKLCGTNGNPEIDFDRFSLIGILTHYWGCKDPDVNIWIFKDDNFNEYNVEFQLKRNGDCKIGVDIIEWYLVPKLNLDYAVKFQIIKI